jgi:O-antigen/teichoic acid export membrane protein
MGLAAAILLVAFSTQIAQKALAAPRLESAVALTGFIAFFNGLGGLYRGILTGLERFYELTIIGIATSILGVLAAITPAIWFGVGGAVAGLLITSVITAWINLARASFWLQQAGIAVTYRRCWDERHELLTTAIPTTLASMMVTPVYWIMSAFLVQQPAGYEAMGGIQAGTQWRNAVLFLPTQMLAAFLPVMASLFTTSPERLRAVQAKALMGVGAAAVLSSLVVILLVPFIAGLYGDKFRLFYWAFVFLAVQGALEACNSVFRNTIIALGRSWYLLISNSVFGIVAAICAFFVIPKYAATGLAFSVALAQAVHLLTQGIMSYRALRSAADCY